MRQVFEIGEIQLVRRVGRSCGLSYASGQLGRYLIAGLKDGPHEITAWGRHVPGGAGKVVRPVEYDRLPAVACALEEQILTFPKLHTQVSRSSAENGPPRSR